MIVQSPCPPVSRLEELLRNALPAGERAELVRHLDGCEPCQRALEERAAGGLSWAAAAATAAPELGADPALEAVIAELKSEVERLSQQGPDTEGEEIDLSFLAPSDRSGSLGRLGHYEVLEVIGQGGMGVVLKALDESLHRVVAIKVMAPHLATNATARKRFMRKARAAAAVSHDHVVTIHGVDEGAGLPYIVMQYVAGLSLQERLDRTGPLELNEVLRIGMQAAAGLAEAHKQGLVHRDIKPANILLENGVERVKLTDFGLARAADDATLTQSGVVAGTPMYMAPEQARGEAVDHRADLFSLGSVLYAMCTGRPPFRASTSLAVLRRVSDETPRPIREINPDVPEWLAAIIERLHAKKPADRIQSAVEVAHLLGRHLAYLQQPGTVTLPSRTAAPTSQVMPPTGLPHRRRWLLAAAALLLLLAALGVSEATGLTQVAATVLRFRTPDGTLVVEIDDPQVKVALDGEELVISGAGIHEVRLRPGQHRLQATRNGAPVQEEVFTITRGGKQVVAVRREAAPAGKPAPANGEIRRFEGHTGPVRTVVFSPDGRRALSCSGWPEGDGTVRLWDVATGRELRRFQPVPQPPPVGGPQERAGQVIAVAFAPDGRRALSAGVGGVGHLWEVETGKELCRLVGHTGTIHSVAFSPDGHRALTSSSDHTVRLWDLQTGQGIHCLKGHTDWVRAACFLPDGRQALTGSRDRTVRLWDLETGREVRSYGGFPEWVEAMALSPDGRRFLAASGNEVRLGDVQTGEELRRLTGHDFGVIGVAFAPDGRRALTGSYDASVRLWDVETGRQVRAFLGHRDWVWGVAFAPDGRTALTGGGGARIIGTYTPGSDFAIRLWALPTAAPAPGKPGRAEPTPCLKLRGLPGVASCAAFSPDGKLLAVGGWDKLVMLWDVATGKMVRRIEGHTDGIRAVLFTPDGKTLITASDDRTVRFWDVATGQQAGQLPEQKIGVYCLGLSADGKTLAVGTGDWQQNARGEVTLWDLAERRELARLRTRTGSVWSVVFSPDGKTLASAGSPDVQLWDTATFKEIASLNHPFSIRPVAVSPDGRLLAAGAAYPGAPQGSDREDLRLWDLSTRKQLAAVRAHGGLLFTLAFAPDGKTLASASKDGAVKVWKVSSKGIEEVASLQQPRGVWFAVFSPDGKTLATGGEAQPVQLWRVDQLLAAEGESP